MDFDALFSGLDRHTLDGITRGSIYALVALGYTMVYGVMKLINFAHSEVFMVGTWTVLGVYTVLGVSTGETLPVVIGATLLALLAAMIASAGTALAVERIAYRPLRKKGAPPLIFLITGIGCSLVLVEIFGQVFEVLFGPPFGRVTVNIPSVLETKELFTIPGIDLTITNTRVIIIVGAIVMMMALDTFVNKSRLGRGVRAVAQDPDTASLMGVNQNRVIMLVFVLGGAMAGVAALLYTIQYDITKFDIGFIIGLKAFTAAVLGGIGNLRGALVGGLLLGIAEVYASTDLELGVGQRHGVRRPRRRPDVPPDRPVGRVPRKGTRMSQILDAYRGLKLRDRIAAAPNWARKVVLLLVIAFAFYLPFLNILPFAYIRTDLTSSGSDWASVLFLVVVYMIAAVGLNVVIGFAGLLDLGYVGFYALGAYSVALFGSPSSPVVEAIQNRFGLSEEWAVPFAMCIPIAIAMSLTAGVILGAPTLRLRGDYLAIVTLGFGEIIRITARNLDGVTNGATGISGVPVPPGPEIDGRPFFNTVDAERWYWLALSHPDPDHLPGLPAGEQPGGSRLAGHPRGRGRRRDHGCGRVQVQAVGLRHRRRRGRHRRAAVRQQAAVRRAQRVHGQPLVPVRGHGGHRWVRQRLRRAARGLPADLPARAVPRVPGVATVRLRCRAGRGDDPASAGAGAEQAKSTRVRGSQARGGGGGD